MTTTVVGFDQVTKSYGDVRAVDALTLAMHPGETVALLGPNGAGKSTTLDLLLGLKRPDSGTICLFGTEPREAIVAGRVGAMLQSGGLMDEVTVAELVRLACDLHPRICTNTAAMPLTLHSLQVLTRARFARNDSTSPRRSRHSSRIT